MAMINFTILQEPFFYIKLQFTFNRKEEKHFRKVQFMYVLRGNNKAVRGLTQYAKNILDFVIQIKETLCIIKRDLVQDILFLFSSE